MRMLTKKAMKKKGMKYYVKKLFKIKEQKIQSINQFMLIGSKSKYKNK